MWSKWLGLLPTWDKLFLSLIHIQAARFWVISNFLNVFQCSQVKMPGVGIADLEIPASHSYSGIVSDSLTVTEVTANTLGYPTKPLKGISN